MNLVQNTEPKTETLYLAQIRVIFLPARARKEQKATVEGEGKTPEEALEELKENAKDYFSLRKFCFAPVVKILKGKKTLENCGEYVFAVRSFMLHAAEREAQVLPFEEVFKDSHRTEDKV